MSGGNVLQGQYIYLLLFVACNITKLLFLRTRPINMFADLSTISEERHINATSIVHQGLEENPWIPQNELRMIVDRVVGQFPSFFVMCNVLIYSRIIN